ncbi:MAG: DUF4142 domain-containing protein [Povalibacter sp.]
MRVAAIRASVLCAHLIVCNAFAAADQPAVPPGDPPPLGTASFVPPANIDQEPLTAASFVTRAAIMNLMETEIGALAQSKSSNAQVKAFASQLTADHRAAQTALKAPAAQAKLAMPGEVDADHQAIRDQLAALSGPAFDTRFIEVMAWSHDQAVRMFQEAAKSPKLTQELQAYANSMLPKLQSHAQMAHTLQSKH